MGNSVASPSSKCLPKPDNPFLQELVDKGVYYLSKVESNGKWDGYMWNVKLPDGWGYLSNKTESTYWGGSVQTGFVIDAHGNYIAKVTACSAGRDDKESASASMSKASGKVTVKWTVNDYGHVILDNDDLLREQQEKQKKIEDQKKMMEDAERRRKHQKQVDDHNQNIDNYQRTCNRYREKLLELAKDGSADYQHLRKTYGDNLEYAYKELVIAAQNLNVPVPVKINIIFE